MVKRKRISMVFTAVMRPPLTARGIEQAQNLHTLLHGVSFDLVYAVNWNGHSIPRDWFSVTASSPCKSYLNSTKCFLATGRCDIIATSCKKMPKTIARGAMTGSMQSPRTVKDFRHFRNVERFIARLSEFQHYQNILVVSHQGVLSLLIARLIGIPAEAMWHFRVDQGCWSAIDINQNSRRYASSIAVPSGSRMHDFSVFLRVSRNDH